MVTLLVNKRDHFAHISGQWLR